MEISSNIKIDDVSSGKTSEYKDFCDITCIVASAGLSEWNGVDFNNYYISGGLPSSFVKSISENSNILYISTDKGL